MAKWKCEICGDEFDNFHAQGFDNKIYCPLCYFKKENQELKEVIDNAVKYIDNLRDESAERQGFYDCFPDDLYIADINELLDILKGSDKE